MFISIKRLLEQRRNGDGGEQDLLEALRQMGRLLLDAMATHAVHGCDTDLAALRRKLKALAHQMDTPQSPIGVLSISSDAIDALETYSQRTNTYLGESNEQMRSMVTMLTETVAEVSGQTDASLARLQAIERQVELASGLEDTRTLRSNLESCLAALREATAQQRTSSASTVQRLQQQIGNVQQRTLVHPGNHQVDIDLVNETFEEPPESISTSYVAAFKLQRAEHIASRFGENAKTQMIYLIGTQLKNVLGPQDRLLRWKGTSFVMFLSTTEPARDLRRRLSETVGAIGQQHIEVGRKSALLSVGVDWVMFPQAQCSSLDAVFVEVDAFLANTRPGAPAAKAAEL